MSTSSDKLYKKKFSEWEWQKNLSSTTAMFMIQKAKQRKRDSNKDTTFHFGGREWPLQKAETTVSRAKRQRGEEHMISKSDAIKFLLHLQRRNADERLDVVVETPRGVTYETPAAIVLSPEAPQSFPEEDEEGHSDANSDPNPMDNDDESMLRLTWEGHTGPEFLTLWKVALQYRDGGGADEAEHRLERAWNGLRHISGVTHEDTNKVAYSLASLYADTGHMDKAVALVERVIQDHVRTLGYKSKVTHQRILQAAEILNGWNRHAEALGLLARSKELLEKSEPDRPRRPRKANKARRVKGRGRATDTGPDNEVSLILADGFGDSDIERINWGLTVARRRVMAGSGTAEVLLEAIIAHCEKHPEENLRQHIVARGELLALYKKLDVVNQHAAVFQDAINALKKTWEHVDWDEDLLEHFEIMEASLQLIANMLKCGYQDASQLLFEEASEIAARAFGGTDERTIWILITIGIVYQTHMEWDDARNWFEQAFARALDEWGPDSKEGVVKSLEVALDREHFSYVSDEGRPYKTIFGVSGITVRPGRLHLD